SVRSGGNPAARNGSSSAGLPPLPGWVIPADHLERDLASETGAQAEGDVAAGEGGDVLEEGGVHAGGFVGEVGAAHEHVVGDAAGDEAVGEVGREQGMAVGLGFAGGVGGLGG